MTTRSPRASGAPRDGGLAMLGAILVVLGLAFLGGQLFEDAFGAEAWPLYVIAPGIALMLVGLARVNASGLTIAGTIVTAVGLVLLYQSATDHWESWAYAWALVGPAASGAGMILHGLRCGSGRMVRAGLAPFVSGLVLFGIGLLFFEGVIGISGDRFPLPEWALPAALIGLGVLALLGAAFARNAEAHPGEDTAAEL